jgi:hypothetical protein
MKNSVVCNIDGDFNAIQICTPGSSEIFPAYA